MKRSKYVLIGLALFSLLDLLTFLALPVFAAWGSFATGLSAQSDWTPAQINVLKMMSLATGGAGVISALRMWLKSSPIAKFLKKFGWSTTDEESGDLKLPEDK